MRFKRKYKNMTLHTPKILPQSWYTIEFLDTATCTEPALELHSRAVPSSEASPLSWSAHREKSRGKTEQGKKLCVACDVKFKMPIHL